MVSLVAISLVSVWFWFVIFLKMASLALIPASQILPFKSFGRTLLRETPHKNVIRTASGIAPACMVSENFELPCSRVVGNLRRPPKTCHSSSESWENGDSKYVIRYAGKIRPFLRFQYLYNIRNYFFWPDLRRLPSQQTPNIWYVLVANMLASNPVVRNISEIHLRLHKLRCIPILTLLFQHGSHSPPPVASL